MLKASDVRHLLFAKEIELRYSRPDNYVIRGLDRRIGDYRRQVGVKTYLSEMLAEWAKRPVAEFRFFAEDNQEIFLEGEYLLDTLAKRWPPPFRVTEVESGKEKYL